MNLADAAKEWLGVPFHHQGRSRAGLDCLGLLLVSAKAVGVELEDLKGYARQPDGKTLISEANRQLTPVVDRQEGDILLMRFRHHPQHIAIVTRDGMIHSHEDSGGVVEHGLDERWRRRIVGVYRL